MEPRNQFRQAGNRFLRSFKRFTNTGSVLYCTSTLSSSLKPTINMVLEDSVYCTAKKQYRKFEIKIPRKGIDIPRKGIDIPRKGIARPQSQIPHSCVCDRFIYSHDRSTYSAAGKYCMWTDPGNIHICILLCREGFLLLPFND
jgi:hypothetical protein